MITAELIIAALGGLGLGGAVTAIVRWRLGGKKASEVTATSRLSRVALNLADAADSKAAAAHQEAAAARDEAAVNRAENRELRAKVEKLEREMHSFRDTARAEANWATRARDALMRAGTWPNGLARTPPILAVIGPQSNPYKD